MDEYRNRPHWTRDSDGEWVVCVPGNMASVGTRIVVSKADGSLQSVVIIGYVGEGVYGHLYDVDTSENDRMIRADETTMLSINKEKSSGEFIGSDGEIYETTLAHCSCRDFAKRRMPCKHMYRLSSELGTDSPLETQKKSLDERLKDYSAELDKIEPKAPPVLYLVVAILFFVSATVGVVGLVYAILYGPTGGVVLGVLLSLVFGFIGAAAFSVYKTAKKRLEEKGKAGGEK